VEKSKLGGGMGLGNMAERAKRIGGRLSIYSSPGQRTSVVLKVKVDEIIYADIPLSSQDLRKY
jgi:signal transduction histidine kinase